MSTIIYADGASKNNPGQASAGAVVVIDGNVAQVFAAKLGIQTNNVAEYHGLLMALHIAADLGLRNPSIRMDSNLAVQQFNGNWKCKEPALKELLAQAVAIKSKFDSIDLAWVPREDNGHADQAGNDVLDGIIADNLPAGYAANVVLQPMTEKAVVADSLTSMHTAGLFDNWPSMKFTQAPDDVQVLVTREDLISLVEEARNAAASAKYDLVDALIAEKSACSLNSNG